MKIFDNPGIFGNASTNPADSIAAVNAGIVGVRQSRQFRQILPYCRKCRKSWLSTIPAIPADLPELSKISKALVFGRFGNLPELPVLSAFDNRNHKHSIPSDCFARIAEGRMLLLSRKCRDCRRFAGIAENVGRVGFRQSRQFRQICPYCRKWQVGRSVGIVEDIESIGVRQIR